MIEARERKGKPNTKQQNNKQQAGINLASLPQKQLMKPKRVEEEKNMTIQVRSERARSAREGALFVRVRGLRSALLFFEDNEMNQKDPKRNKGAQKGH